MKTTSIPSQTMKEFFARADVRKLQEIQKGHVYGSKAHLWAYYQLCELALKCGAGDYIKREDY